MDGSWSSPEPQDFQVRAPLPPSGIIYEGNLVIPGGEVNNNPDSSGEEDMDSELSQDQQEEGGSLESRVRQRMRLYSSNLEIIETKLKLRNQGNGEDEGNKVDGENFGNQVVGLFGENQDDWENYETNDDEDSQAEGAKKDDEAEKSKTEMETEENPGGADKKSIKKAKGRIQSKKKKKCM